jgi:hypothetical protein
MDMDEQPLSRQNEHLFRRNEHVIRQNELRLAIVARDLGIVRESLKRLEQIATSRTKRPLEDPENQ